VFQDGLGPGEMIGFFHGDRVVFERAAELAERLPEPFLLRVSTMSMHSPHDPLPASLDAIDLGDLERTPLGNYLDRVGYFDRALGQFMARIERRFPDALIVLHGDHAESRDLDRARVRAISGHDVTDPGRVPLIFVHPRLDPHAPRPATAGLIDVAPSVLDLLGIEQPPSFLGTTLFGHGPEIAARWDGFTIGSEIWDGEHCLSRSATARLDPGTCDGLRARARAELHASWFLTRQPRIPTFARMK
jgi:phosphoglycerol transferase MdoB-like AlkP superfamily enzyme